ncbi:Protein of unknown function [Cotesia congregata]|uniref:ZSWIM1/3 RNaseH-like domain-containing protein n=1 Tax=Cotesia congregata TaxID=51543 RepID=A0A8J2HHY0_COTCN|nr:Protein of unknown function [Cotesia congregata]
MARNLKLVHAFPENRRLPPELRQKVEEYLNLGCSNKKIRYELSSKYNILATSKDISNIRQSLRPEKSNDLPTFVNLLKTKYGCSTKIKVTDDGNFQALFFTNTAMQNSMKNWPEMLFIDGTYKLFNLGFTLYLIMIQTGSGRGEIVGAAILASETSDVMKWVAETFKEFNREASAQTKTIMTDKDLTERSAFAESSFVNDYADLLAKTAFDKFNEELNKYDSVTITKYCNETRACYLDVDGYPIMSSITECRCHFRKSFKLPCVHILVTRKFFNENQFCSELCDSKWLKATSINKFNQEFHEILLADTIFNNQSTNTTMTTDDSIIATDIIEEDGLKITCEEERKQILQKYFEKIMGNSLKVPEEEFKLVQNQLEKIASNDKQNGHNNTDEKIVILPEKKILRGRPKSARKTTTGFFPRKNK